MGRQSACDRYAARLTLNQEAMKTIFDHSAREEIIERIALLGEQNEPEWGAMTLNQMLRHCILWDEVAQGKRTVNQPLLGRLLGKLILRGFVKDDSPLRRYLPAVEEMKMDEPVRSDVAAEKQRWIALVKEYPHLSNQTWEVPFFGTVTREQAGCLAYKHSDHHLRQFNA